MNKYIEAALESYETIKTELKNFTRANTDFELDIDDGGYPLVFTFTPSVDAAQASLFEPDENGVLGDDPRTSGIDMNRTFDYQWNRLTWGSSATFRPRY